MIDFTAIPPAAGFETMGDFAAEVARLAALPLHEYERVRKAEAKRLGQRVSALDAQVKTARPQGEGDGGQGQPIVLPEIEPWADAVDGAELVRDLVAQIRRFIMLSDHDALTVALWIIFAHAHAAAFHSPRLALLSPVHRCGKSTLLRVVGMLVVRKVSASSVTASAVFRLISEADGLVVLLIDEFDQIGDAEKAGELIAVVNAGHCKLDAYVIRTVPVGGDLRARKFDCWAPTIVASNKALPVTWMDRSITLRLKRKARGDHVDRLRDDLDLGFDDLASRAARWAADNLDQLRGADPALPAVLNDRQADNWRMLVAIADLAGCGEQARDAAIALSVAETEDKQARGELLLQDIRSYFDQIGKDRTASLSLVLHLNDLEGRPWHEYSRGAPMSQNQLANLLRPFGISSEHDPRRSPPAAPRPHGTGAKGASRPRRPPRGTCAPRSNRRGIVIFLRNPPFKPPQRHKPRKPRLPGVPNPQHPKPMLRIAIGGNPQQSKACGVVADRNPPAAENKVSSAPKRVRAAQPPIQTATTPQATETAASSDSRTATSKTMLRIVISGNPRQTAACGVVADRNPPPGEKTYQRQAQRQGPRPCGAASAPRRRRARRRPLRSGPSRDHRAPPPRGAQARAGGGVARRARSDAM